MFKRNHWLYSKIFINDPTIYDGAHISDDKKIKLGFTVIAIVLYTENHHFTIYNWFVNDRKSTHRAY